jgi:hypothetical protein
MQTQLGSGGFDPYMRPEPTPMTARPGMAWGRHRVPAHKRTPRGAAARRSEAGPHLLLVSQWTMTFVVVKSTRLLSITILAVTAGILAARVARKRGLFMTA